MRPCPAKKPLEWPGLATNVRQAAGASRTVSLIFRSRHPLGALQTTTVRLLPWDQRSRLGEEANAKLFQTGA